MAAPSAADFKQCAKLLKQIKKEDRLLEGCALIRKFRGEEAAFLDEGQALAPLVALFDAKLGDAVLEAAGPLIAEFLESGADAVERFCAEGEAKKSSPCHGVKRFIELLGHTSPAVSLSAARCLTQLKSLICHDSEERPGKDLSATLDSCLRTLQSSELSAAQRVASADLLLAVSKASNVAYRALLERKLEVDEGASPNGKAESMVGALLRMVVKDTTPTAVQQATTRLVYCLAENKAARTALVDDQHALGAVKQVFLAAVHRLENPAVPASKSEEDAARAEADNLSAWEQAPFALLLWVWCIARRESEPVPSLGAETTGATGLSAAEIAALLFLLGQDKAVDLRINAAISFAHLRDDHVASLLAAGSAETLAQGLCKAQDSEEARALEHALHLCLKIALVSRAAATTASDELEDNRHDDAETSSHSGQVDIREIISAESAMELIRTVPLKAGRFLIKLIRADAAWIGQLASQGAFSACTQALKESQNQEASALLIELAAQLSPWLAKAENREMLKPQPDWHAVVGILGDVVQVSVRETDANIVDFADPLFRPVWIFRENETCTEVELGDDPNVSEPDADGVQEAEVNRKEDDAAEPEQVAIGEELGDAKLDMEDENEAESHEEGPKETVDEAGDSSEACTSLLIPRSVCAGRWKWNPRVSTGELEVFQAWKQDATSPIDSPLTVFRCTTAKDLLGGTDPRDELTPAGPGPDDATAVALETWPEFPWAEDRERQEDFRAVIMSGLAALADVDHSIEKANNLLKSGDAVPTEAPPVGKEKGGKGKSRKAASAEPALQELLFSAHLLDDRLALGSVVSSVLQSESGKGAVSVATAALGLMNRLAQLPGGRQALIRHCAKPESTHGDDVPQGELVDESAVESGTVSTSLEHVHAGGSSASMASFDEHRSLPPSFISNFHKTPERDAMRTLVKPLVELLYCEGSPETCVLAALRCIGSLCKDIKQADWNQDAASDMICATVLELGGLVATVAWCAVNVGAVREQISQTALELSNYLITRGLVRQDEWCTWEEPAVDDDGEPQVEVDENGATCPVMVTKGRGPDPNFGPDVVQWAHLLDVSGPYLPRFRQRAGQTALHVAAQLPDEQVGLVATLLRAQAQTDPRDELGTTPLMCALASGRDATVNALLGSQLVDVDAVDAAGNNVLKYAFVAHPRTGEPTQNLQVILGSPRFIPSLLSHGVDLDISDASSGSFPLHFFSVPFQLEAVVDHQYVKLVSDMNALDGPLLELFVRSGATLDLCDMEGRTALHQALRNSRFEVAADLVRAGANPNILDAEGNTALHIVCALSASPDLVLAILNAGSERQIVNGEFVDHGRGLPAHCRTEARVQEILAKAFSELEHPAAICDVRLSAVELLTLANNADWTPLHCLMAGSCNPEAAQLAHFSNVLEQRQKGGPARVSPSEEPRRQLRLPVAQALAASVELKQVVGSRGRGGLSPLGLLMQDTWAEKELVELLLQAGADPFAVDEYGLVPLHYALLSGARSDQLSQATPSPNIRASIAFLPEVFAAAQLPEDIDLDLIWAALSLSPVPARKPSAHQGHVASCLYGTVLTAAARFGNVDLLRELVGTGQIDLNGVEYFGSASALHLAAQYGHLECVKILVESGADVAVLDSSGNTVLHSAVFGEQPDVVALLVGTDAEPGPVRSLCTRRNSEGQAPHFLAEVQNMSVGVIDQSRSDEVVRTLLNIFRSVEKNEFGHGDDATSERVQFEGKASSSEDEAEPECGHHGEAKEIEPSAEGPREAGRNDAGGVESATPSFDWSPVEMIERQVPASDTFDGIGHTHPCYRRGIMFHEWVRAEELYKAKVVAESELAAIRIQAIHRGCRARTQARIRTKHPADKGGKMSRNNQKGSKRRKGR